MNGLYFIPIFSVVICGMLFKKVPPVAAKIALISGLIIIGCGYFVSPFTDMVSSIHEFHFLGLVFLLLITILLAFSLIKPAVNKKEELTEYVVDMTPWPLVKVAGAVLVTLVVLIYAAFADF